MFRKPMLYCSLTVGSVGCHRISVVLLNFLSKPLFGACHPAITVDFQVYLYLSIYLNQIIFVVSINS